ncbi:tyrosine-protein phosphatase non-receptor type, partial [Elysia marginata]
AGCGRTGAIVAIDFVWTLLEQGRFDETFSLYELICNLREQRMSMVQTADQYALVNKVLKSLCEEWLEKMASHTYVNVELKDTGDQEGDHHENRVIMESSNKPEVSTKLAEDRLRGNAADLEFSPEAGDVAPPSYMAPKPPSGAGASSNYENVILLPDRTPVLKTVKADNSKESSTVDAAANEDSQKPLHRTVIQLGPNSASPAAAPSLGDSGGKQTLAPSPPPPTSLSSASSGASSELKVNRDAGDNISSSPSHPVANPPSSTSSRSPAVAVVETSKLTSSTSFSGESHCASPGKADKRKSLPPNGTKESNRKSFTLPQDIITRL